jgi:hypothetical protein
VPTDHACRMAADQAALAVDPVRAVLVPPPPSEEPEDVLPVTLRNYYGEAGGSDAAGPGGRRPAAVAAPPPAGVAMGAHVLLIALDGLRAELAGSLAAWYAELAVRLPVTLGVPDAAEPGRRPARLPGEWDALTDLRLGAQDVLTALAGHRRADQGGPGALTWRLALVEDAMAGILRRTGVPAGTAVRCAAELEAAARPLFGLSRPAEMPAAR